MKLIDLIEKLKELEMCGYDQLEVFINTGEMSVKIIYVDVECYENSDEPAWIALE